MGLARGEEEQHLVNEVSGSRRRSRPVERTRCKICKYMTILLLLGSFLVVFGGKLGIFEWETRWPFVQWKNSKTPSDRGSQHRLIWSPFGRDKNNRTHPSQSSPQEPSNTSLRISALEVAVQNLTQALEAQSSALAATQKELSAQEVKVERLQNEAFSSSHDLDFQNEVESRLNGLDTQLSLMHSMAAASYADLDKKINATAMREREDAINLNHDMDTNAAAQRTYVDAKSSDTQAAIDTKLNQIYQTLGDYKATTQVRFDTERDLIYDWIAGTFALLGFLVTLAGVYGHTRKKHQPDIQRKILTLLWMPPIYSACSWLSLLYPAAAPGLNMVRDGYEAYTIWAFGSFLLSTVGDDSHRQGVAGILRRLSMSPTKQRDCDIGAKSFRSEESISVNNQESRQRRYTKQISSSINEELPLVYTPRPKTKSENEYNALFERVVAKLKDDGDLLPRAFWPPCGPKADARSFVRQCTFATMQFVLLKPAVAVASYVLTAAQNDSISGEAESSSQNTSHPSTRDWIDKTRMALFIIDNISVTIAFAGLLKVYHAVAHHLADRNPWPKFCSVKGIVFITFWQGVIIWAMTRTERLNTDVDIADTVQNFLICVEMFIASVVHIHTFSPDEWDPNYDPATFGVSDSFALNDFFTELGSLFGGRMHTPAETGMQKNIAATEEHSHQEHKEEFLDLEASTAANIPLEVTSDNDDDSANSRDPTRHTYDERGSIDSASVLLEASSNEILPQSGSLMLPAEIETQQQDRASDRIRGHGNNPSGGENESSAELNVQSHSEVDEESKEEAYPVQEEESSVNFQNT